MQRRLAQNLGVLLVIATALVIYLPGLSSPFVFDDHHGILENVTVRDLGRFPGALAPPPHGALGDRPVANLTFAINYAIGEYGVRGYRAVNLIVHIACALLVIGIVRRTLDSPHDEETRERWGGAASFVGTIAGLLFVAHPLQSECVMYVVQRTESLMAMFYLLTLYAAIRGWEQKATSKAARPEGPGLYSARTRRAMWFVAAIAACALGMGSKEVMVSAPVVVWLYDRAFVSGTFFAALRRSPWLYACLACAWLPLVAMKLSGTPHPTMGFGAGMSPWHYLLTSAGSIVIYLRLIVWPADLTIMHDPPIATSIADVWAQGILVLVLLGATVWALLRRPALGLCLAAFFLILAPTTSFLPIVGEVTAERRMYLPMAIAVSLAAVLGAAMVRSLGESMPKRETLLSAITAGVVTALLLALSAASVQRVRDYRSEVSIWTDAEKKFPQSHTAQVNLGFALTREGRVDEAIEHYRLALAIAPRNVLTMSNLGDALARQNKHPEAIAQFEAALKVMADHPVIHYQLGNSLRAIGRLDDAKREYESAVKLFDANAKPDLVAADAWMSLGHLALMRNDLKGAEAAYRAALNRDARWIAPATHFALRMNLGRALAMQGRFREAAGEFEQAVKLSPKSPEAHALLERAQAAAATQPH